MRKCTILFSGRNGLDNESLRFATLRIPEVSMRLREAQKIIDESMGGRFDLYTYLNSENTFFLNQIYLKSLASAVVQLGLYDRYIKQAKGRADFIIGTANGDSAMQVVSGFKTLREMILESAAFNAQVITRLTDGEGDIPILTGLALPEYQTIRFNPGSEVAPYEKFNYQSMDCLGLLKELATFHDAKEIINIGPQFVFDPWLTKSRLDFDVRLVDSLEIDPMLSWVWSEGRVLSA